MQSGEILVSISCITYNHAPYIRQCLDGFMMQQTNFVFEVLIHDDASTDGTTEIIKEYERKYPDIIKPIYEEENQWVKGRRGSAVFNFPRAKGKYIAMCEGDDYWTDPLKLQKQVDFLETNSDCSMCFHRVTIANESTSNVFISCAGIEEREYRASELFARWIVPTTSMVFRSEVNTIPIRCFEDILNFDSILILKCCRAGKVMAMGDDMAVYRMHCGGVSYSPQFVQDRIWRYPAHFLCIKKNFGDMIDSKEINRKLSKSYWDRREMFKPGILSLVNKIKAFWYDPLYIVLKYIRR